jgi:outer membrane biosynthesis protein TonB
MAMRAGVVVSVLGHGALLAWVLVSLHAAEPLDASGIEAIPVNFVQIEDVTSLPKGVAVAKVEPKPPAPEPIKKIIEEPPPLPEPAPPPPPPPEPTPPVADEPPPLPEPEPQPPEPEPTPPPPEPTPPEPAPPPPAPAAEAPPPPETPPPPPQAEAQPKPEAVPTPKPRPKMPKPAPQVVKKDDPNKFDPDRIAALLDKDKDAPQQPPPDKPPEQTASVPPAQPTVGGTTASVDARMTANELDALRSRLAQCWSPPIGWTDPAEVRVVLLISLNPDGSVASEPEVMQRPDGRYAQPAAESALRAVRRCAPYALPAEKYESWKQVKVTFDPTEMGGG